MTREEPERMDGPASPPGLSITPEPRSPSAQTVPGEAMSTTELLNKVPLFKGLESDELERIASASESVSFRPGQVIVEIGDPGKALFLIVEGSVQVLYPARTSDFELARLGPGEFFGEMALLNDKPRSATVKAMGEVRALKLDKDGFRRIILDTPRVALKVLEVLSFRIRTADEQISGLSDQTQRDPLTRLLNRRAFHERISEECDRHRRYGHPFSIVLVDMDKFRDINDTFGQDAGDAALSWVGRLLTEHTRGCDIGYRIGGEEFGLLCPAIPAELARNVAQRVVEVVSEAKPPVSFDLTVTLSAGVAGCPEHAHRPDELYRIADRALLRAKTLGRNRVCDPADLTD